METQQTQQTKEQGMQPEVRGAAIGGFSIVLELKPERIQEPLAAAEGGSMVFELALVQSQPVTIAFGAMQVTITLHGADAASPTQAAA